MTTATAALSPGTPTLFPNLIFPAAAAALLSCVACRKRMRLLMIEHLREEFALHAFTCEGCDLTETYVIEG